MGFIVEMGPLPLLYALDPTPLVRTYRSGLERVYHVSVEQDAGNRYAYRLRLRIVRPKTTQGETPSETSHAKLEMRLTDYRASLSGLKVKAATIGGGATAFESNGLPEALNVGGPTGPIWFPLLSLYLPSEKGEFKIPPLDVGTGLTFTGEGTAVRKDGTVTITTEGGFLLDGREMGRLGMTTVLDSEGWPTRAEGKLENGDGVYRFTVAK